MMTSVHGALSAHSNLKDSEAAARELVDALAPAQPSLVTYFASSDHDLGAVAAVLSAGLPGATVVGCTTAGEFETAAGNLKGGLVGIALPERVVKRAEALVIEGLRATSAQAGDALGELAERFGQDPRDLDPERFVGLVLPDGLSLQEETLMEALGDAAPDLLVVGGSAGDDLKFQGTFVALGDRVATDAAVLVLLEMGAPFRVVKNSHFVPTERTFTATRVDEATRTVYEFDGKPALTAYAEALGIAPEAVDVAVMAANPVGLVIGDDPFVRSFMRLGEDGAMILASNVLSGSEVTLLKGKDMVETTRRLVDEVEAELGSVSGALVFNCIFRWVEAANGGYIEEVYKVLDEKGIPAAGFHTYGEQYLGHINQTVTMLCFGA